MFVLLTYDVDFKNQGEKRLRKISKICKKYGIRVQNSVFELDIDTGTLKKLLSELENIISDDDSIRIYKLGDNIKNKIDILGKREFIEISQDDSFIF